MDLTPREIQEKQFHDVFRGYNHEEVDVFLDEVAEAFERTYQENQSFHHRLRDLEEQLKTARATEDMLKRTLITAQKTAEEAVDEARSRAQGLVIEAEKKSAEIVAVSEERAKQIIDQANSKQSELETKLEGLRRFEQEYRTRLNAFIESQLQVLAEGPVAPGKPMTAAEPAAAEPAAPKSPPPPAARAEPPAARAETPTARAANSDAILPKKDEPAAPFAARTSKEQPSADLAAKAAQAEPAAKAAAPKSEAAAKAEPAAKAAEPAAAKAEPPQGNGGEGRPKTQQSNGGSGARPRTSVEAAAPAKQKSEASLPPVTRTEPKVPPVLKQREPAPQKAAPEEELDEESIRKLFWGEE